MLRKVTIIQCPVGQPLGLEDNLFIFKQKPDFVILPEYFNVDPAVRDTPLNTSQSPEYLKYCQTLSDRFDTVLIAGTSVELDENRFYNSSSIYKQGRLIGRFRKLHPTNKEREHGLSPGGNQSIFQIDGVRISILICADVLFPENFQKLSQLKPDIIFVPTTSPLRANETIREKFERDHRIFITGAGIAGSYIVKCCAVGQLWGGRLQGRSQAAAPWGILTRIPPDEEDRKRILSIVLDIDELRDFRRKKASIGQK